MPYPFNIATTDGYQTLSCPGTKRIGLQVSNASVAIGFGQGPPGGCLFPDPDESYLPVVGGITRTCDAIRIKSLVPGKSANVILNTS